MKRHNWHLTAYTHPSGWRVCCQNTSSQSNSFIWRQKTSKYLEILVLCPSEHLLHHIELHFVIIPLYLSIFEFSCTHSMSLVALSSALCFIRGICSSSASQQQDWTIGLLVDICLNFWIEQTDLKKSMFGWAVLCINTGGCVCKYTNYVFIEAPIWVWNHLELIRMNGIGLVFMRNQVMYLQHAGECFIVSWKKLNLHYYLYKVLQSLMYNLQSSHNVFCKFILEVL